MLPEQEIPEEDLIGDFRKKVYPYDVCRSLQQEFRISPNQQRVLKSDSTPFGGKCSKTALCLLAEHEKELKAVQVTLLTMSFGSRQSWFSVNCRIMWC